jgi:hypothetical protein
VAEAVFLSVYGSPALQAAVGVDEADPRSLHKSGRSVLQQRLLAEKIEELKSRIEVGGLREALARAMIHVGMVRGGGPDERSLAALRRLRAVEDDKPRLTLAEFKQLVRDQYAMLVLDQERAIESLPRLLPKDPELRQKAFDALCHVLRARGELAGEAQERLQRIAKLFGVPANGAAEVTAGRKIKLAKAV